MTTPPAVFLSSAEVEAIRIGPIQITRRDDSIIITEMYDDGSGATEDPPMIPLEHVERVAQAMLIFATNIVELTGTDKPSEDF